MNIIIQEKKTLSAMIRLYCRLEHHQKNLCAYCRNLEDYALKRLEFCVYGGNKPACKHCPAHCYSMLMRQEIKKVMRVAGPRMLILHPMLTITHMINEKHKVKDIAGVHWKKKSTIK